jgi:uncharacterized protein (DUF1800 family)
MQNYIQSLATLLTLPHNVHTARAACHLVARQYVKDNPLPTIAECDAEMVAINGGN